MFDIGFFELCLIGVIALLVIGPEKLPRAARTVGLWVGKGRNMIRVVKYDIDEQVRMEELKETMENAAKVAEKELSESVNVADSTIQDIKQSVSDESTLK